MFEYIQTITIQPFYLFKNVLSFCPMLINLIRCKGQIINSQQIQQIPQITIMSGKNNMTGQKQEEGQEMFQFDESDRNQPQIGTQIFDPSLPSDLNFESEQKNQLEGEEVSKDDKYSKARNDKKTADDIRTYTFKGKGDFKGEPKYKEASIVHDHVDTFEVKALDQVRSGGWKSVWESVVGYVKRQICIEEGYIYIFENTKQGYMTHGSLKIKELFKIFADPEDSKLRLVFRVEGQDYLKNKNFQVKNIKDLIDKICEEASKIGLSVVSD